MQNDPYQPGQYPQTPAPRPETMSVSYIEQSPKKPSYKVPILIALVPIMLVLGLASGIAIGALTKEKEMKPQLDEAKAEVTKSVVDNTTPHMVVARGYPLGANFSLITKLGFPDTLQAVSVHSNNQNPGLTDKLTQQYNDEMGRWIIGNPTQENGQVGEMSIIAIQDKWKASAWQSLTQVPVADELVAVSTPAEKQAFVEKMKKDSANCSADDIVKIDFMTICTKVIAAKQSADTYSPGLHLYGYGEVRGMPMVLLGSYLMRDDKTYTVAQQQQFISSPTPPEYVKNLKAAYLKSLKTTTFAVVDNS